MIFIKCEKCHKNRVAYKVTFAIWHVPHYYCADCTLFMKFENYKGFEAIKKISLDRKLNFLGNFLLSSVIMIITGVFLCLIILAL